MPKLKLLITGDSFAADWSSVSKSKGWPNLLTEEYDVTNIAQAGCSEYKIYKQLCSVDLQSFDHIIVCHTSPYRIYVKENPIHHSKPLHKNSCFIYNDIVEHDLSCIKEYFEKYFDLEYAEHIHNLLIKEIDAMCPAHTLHIANFEWDRLYTCKNWLDLYPIFKSNRGNVNHYNSKGNKLVYNTIGNKLKNNE